MLGERHRPRVEPDVDHLRHPSHRLAARLPAGLLGMWTGELDPVHERAVVIGERHSRALAQLGERADQMDVSPPAAPHREGRAPVALAGESPVDVVLQPVAEPPVLDVWGVPAHGLVGGQQLLAQAGRRDVPGGFGVIQQGRAAAPAVGVGVLVLLDSQEQAALAQVGYQIAGQGGVLDEASLERLPVGAQHALVVGAVGPDRVVEGARVGGVEWHVRCAGRDPVVVLAEGRREVHDARAVLGRDERVGEDRQGPRRAIGEHEDRPRIALVPLDELRARESLEDH